MGAGASMWATPTDLAQFAIGVMLSYTGRTDEVISQDMAIQMLTPQIGDRGLGPLSFDEGGDRFYFMHPGANDGYKSVLIAYPSRGQGVIIMTNSDAGEALWGEILNSVSAEYGWLKNYTTLYVIIAAAIILAPVGFLILRRARGRRSSS